MKLPQDYYIYKTNDNTRCRYCLVYQSINNCTIKVSAISGIVASLHNVLNKLNLPKAKFSSNCAEIFRSEGEVAVGITFTSVGEKKLKALGFEIYKWD